MTMKTTDPELRPRFRDLPPAQRKALLEKIAVTLERNAHWAGEEGDDALEMAMQSVGRAIFSVAGDLAETDIQFAEDVAAQALQLLTAFHVRHPRYPIRPTLH